MPRALLIGLLSGLVLSGLLIRGKLRNRFTSQKVGRRGMTAEEKVIEQMRSTYAERPEVGTPDHAFVKNWAYGNAGLEDERITEEQVERVLNEKSA